MLNTTLSKLHCPSCCGVLALSAASQVKEPVQEIRSGLLECRSCGSSYPILAGVAVLVQDVAGYLVEHVKGISKVVPDAEIPPQFESEYLEARAELADLPPEHIEEDLEADRVNALYLMTHYLRAEGAEAEPWWKPERGGTDFGSPLLDRLIREHWDHGPFEKIENWVAAELSGKPGARLVELGCGVGGLYARLRKSLNSSAGSYLGVDSSFASIALARHFALGAAYRGRIAVPADLLQGAVSRELKMPTPPSLNKADGSVDFVVTDVDTPALVPGGCNVSIALNMIDMLAEPSVLPALQYDLTAAGGLALQSGPYIWHDQVAAELRANLPAEIRDSARAVEWLYSNAGFRVEASADHVPWLFFKHCRQLEIYSVHLLRARKSG